MTGIIELGHVGLHVADLELMRDFYSRVMGLTITDEDLGRGIVFLSSRPDYEHHELVLAGGRDVPAGAKVLQQLSWRVCSCPGGSPTWRACRSITPASSKPAWTSSRW